MRGGRYCEILVANLAPPNLRVQVFTTEGLNECPADAWAAVDARLVAGLSAQCSAYQLRFGYA